MRFNRNTFLAGVFLSDPLFGTAPTRLNLLNGDFPTLSPVLQQTFFIGDGLTGRNSGMTQRFYVSDGATRLFFGLVDGYAPQTLTISGTPRFYNDNGGSYTARCVVTFVPEPTGFAVFVAIAVATVVRQRRPRSSSQ